MTKKGATSIDHARELGQRRTLAERYGITEVALAEADGDLLTALERGIIKEALTAGGNQTAAARILGLSRYALRYRLGLRPPSSRNRLDTLPKES